MAAGFGIGTRLFPMLVASMAVSIAIREMKNMTLIVYQEILKF